MPAGIHWFVCLLSLMSDVLKGSFFNESLQEFIAFAWPLSLMSDVLEGICFMNACRNSFWFCMPFKSATHLPHTNAPETTCQPETPKEQPISLKTTLLQISSPMQPHPKTPGHPIHRFSFVFLRKSLQGM